MIADEPEDEAEETEEYVPEQVFVQGGSFVIFDMAEFEEAFNAYGCQMTEEGGLYVLDKTSKKLRPIDLDMGSNRPGLKRVQ
ncbi:MAG: hypothetical protein A3E01_04675 [Gammaproteobacteria bacterium RIFCSPHIGHO2_12_FULL_63_22]|nr:MAG: hypothetical protein A3E01_04675 [Gammaproteobacteria bacterium RIFCSPHIGHO2_12_FULL_63_22]